LSVSDYSATLAPPQKQLFADQDPRKNARSGGHSLREASNETRIEASNINSNFLSQTPYYTSNGSEVSQVNRKISTSPFNFSSVDKQRESLDSIGDDKQQPD
jgi:hypothetical protein